ncbi:hypothetical protein HZ326_1347 [Fusarium oxysporum f. sp. albedinis]|nr:hypothetical protein HZ326_1347 [Fusarium oxysporum f. sp. albedinis]
MLISCFDMQLNGPYRYSAVLPQYDPQHLRSTSKHQRPRATSLYSTAATDYTRCSCHEPMKELSMDQ